MYMARSTNASIALSMDFRLPLIMSESVLDSISAVEQALILRTGNQYYFVDVDPGGITADACDRENCPDSGHCRNFL